MPRKAARVIASIDHKTNRDNKCISGRFAGIAIFALVGHSDSVDGNHFSGHKLQRFTAPNLAIVPPYGNAIRF